MKFLFISEAGDGVGIAYRVAQGGNEVAVWIKDDEASKRGNGLVEKVHDWEFELSDNMIVVSDCTGSGLLCDALRESRYQVIGGSQVMDRLEMDRNFAQKVMSEAGLATPKSKHFTDWDKAFDLVREHEERLVFKPEGDLSGVVPSYVSESQEDLLEMMEIFRSRSPMAKPEFTIQEFVDGVCVSTECWFNGVDFVKGMFNHTLERKQLMCGDLGPSGGCTGNVVWAARQDSVLVDQLLKLRPFLQEERYCGPIDINTVVSESGIYGLEFTPRFGYDATPTLFYELLDGPVDEVLLNIAAGLAPTFGLRSGYAAGIRLSLSPWPAEKYHGPEGVPIRGLGRSPFEHLCFCDVMENKDGQLCTSEGYGIVGVATGYGGSIDEAFAEAYKIANKAQIPEKQMRMDLAEVFKKDMRRLNRILGEFD